MIFIPPSNAGQDKLSPETETPKCGEVLHKLKDGVADVAWEAREKGALAIL